MPNDKNREKHNKPPIATTLNISLNDDEVFHNKINLVKYPK